MKVAITGANSAIGQAILRASEEQPAFSFVAGVRSERAANQLPPLSRRHQLAYISYDESKSLGFAFHGADAVIHLPGVLIERPESTYEAANVETTRAVVEAAREQGVPKLVLVSAVGAKEGSPNRYYHTKGQAEALLQNSGLDHTILQVPLLLGKGTEGSAALRRYLGRSTLWLIGGGRHRERPLDVRDVARAALRGAHPAVARNRTLELAGPRSLPYREILERAAQLTGRRVRIRHLPRGLVKGLLAIRQRLGRPGFSTDVLEVITADTQLDSTGAASELGIELTGLDEMIQHSLEEITRR
jgi:NADH dehydrogenase